MCPTAHVQTCPGECAATARLWMSKTGLTSVYGGPWAQRGEPKLNKYLLHPVCIKGLHTWLWRQSDIKQGGAAQPAPAGMRAHIYDLPYLALKITLFIPFSTIPIVCFSSNIFLLLCSTLLTLWFNDHYVFFFLFFSFLAQVGAKKKKSLIQNSQTGVTGYHHTVYTGANSTFNFPAPHFLFSSFSRSRPGAFLWICLDISICRSTTGLPARLPACKPVNRLVFWVAEGKSWSVWCLCMSAL